MFTQIKVNHDHQTRTYHWLIGLLTLGCKDHVAPTPDTCKLTAIDRDNNKHAYTWAGPRRSKPTPKAI